MNKNLMDFINGLLNFSNDLIRGLCHFNHFTFTYIYITLHFRGCYKFPPIHQN